MSVHLGPNSAGSGPSLVELRPSLAEVRPVASDSSMDQYWPISSRFCRIQAQSGSTCDSGRCTLIECRPNLAKLVRPACSPSLADRGQLWSHRGQLWPVSLARPRYSIRAAIRSDPPHGREVRQWNFPAFFERNRGRRGVPMAPCFARFGPTSVRGQRWRSVSRSLVHVFRLHSDVLCFRSSMR